MLYPPKKKWKKLEIFKTTVGFFENIQSSSLQHQIYYVCTQRKKRTKSYDSTVKYKKKTRQKLLASIYIPNSHKEKYAIELNWFPRQIQRSSEATLNRKHSNDRKEKTLYQPLKMLSAEATSS